MLFLYIPKNDVTNFRNFTIQVCVCWIRCIATLDSVNTPFLKGSNALAKERCLGEADVKVSIISTINLHFKN